jgi:MFS family permease
MTWKDSVAPLREPNFAWYFASRFSNTLGSMMAGIALTFAVLDLTDSASALGQVLAARTVPMVLFLLFGGVIADRFPRTVVLQLSNVSSAATQGLVAYLVITGNAELWMVITLEAVNGTVSAISFPAMASMVPQLVPRPQLQRANALLSLVRGGLTVLGPTVGALLVVTVGSGWALAFDALTWLVAAVLLLPMRIRSRPPATERSSTLRDLREGWSFFVSTTWLWVVVLAFGVLNAIHTGAWFTLGPAVAKQTIGEQGWGLVLSAESVGLLVMTVVLLRLDVRRPLLTGMLACSLMSIPLVVLGVQPHLVALVVASFVAGAGIEVFSIGWNVAMQENIDDSMLSRAYSYDALGSFVAMPVGQLLYGPLGATFGYRDVLVASGILYAVVALLTLGSRSVRDLRRTPQSVPVS